MKKSCLAFALLACAAQAEEKPEAVVEKAISAHGAKLAAKLPAHTWKAKGVAKIMDMKMEYTADYAFQQPDKLRFDLKMKEGELTAATDGKVAWEKFGDMMRDMEKKKMAEFQHTAYVMNLSMLLPLLDKDIKLASLDESKDGERTLVGIKASSKGRRDVSLFFDKKTGLLHKSSTRVHDEFADKEVTQENVFTGYKVKDEQKIFTKMTILRDGKEFLTEEFLEQKALEKFDAAKFAKPKEKE